MLSSLASTGKPERGLNIYFCVKQNNASTELKKYNCGRALHDGFKSLPDQFFGIAGQEIKGTRLDYLLTQ